MVEGPSSSTQCVAEDSDMGPEPHPLTESPLHNRSKRLPGAGSQPPAEAELSPDYVPKKRFKRRALNLEDTGSDTERTPQSNFETENAVQTPAAQLDLRQQEKEPKSFRWSSSFEAETVLTGQNSAERDSSSDEKENAEPEEETLFGSGEDANGGDLSGLFADPQATKVKELNPERPTLICTNQNGSTDAKRLSSKDLHFKTEDLYENIVQKLSFDESQRFFCYTLERLTQTHKEALNRLRRLEQKGIDNDAADGVIDPCYIPFHPGSSVFYMEGKKRDHYSRFLAYNSCGVVILTAQSQLASKEIASAKDCIEVISSIAGVGQRRRTLNNDLKRFNMAAIGPNGFCLARGYATRRGRSRPPSKTSRSDTDNGPTMEELQGSDEETRNRVDHSDADSQDDEDEDVGNDLLLNEAGDDDAAEEGLEAPSHLEYHAFNTWGPISKSWWSKTFSRNETLYGVAVGSDWIAAITSKRLLRIFSHTGLAIGVIRLCGMPVTVVASASRLMTITVQAGAPLSAKSAAHAQRNAGRLGCDTTFDCRVIDVASMKEVVRTAFSTPFGAHLVWAGFTPRLMPLIVESSGDVWALLPVFSSGSRRRAACSFSRSAGPFNENASTVRWDWVPVLDLKETLPPHQAARIASDYGHSLNATSRHSASISNYIWIGGAEESALRAIRLSRRQRAPPPNPDLVLLSCPFCLPILQSASVDRQLSYLDWTAHLADDSDFKDMAKVASLPWEVFDELRLRFELERRHIQQILAEAGDPSLDTAPLSPEERIKVLKLDQKLAIKLDKTLFRLFMKAIAENRVERALEAAEKFAFSKTFEVARAQAEARAMKSLAEKLNVEIEKRQIAETEEATRRQLQNCTNHLRDIEVASAASITPGQSKRHSDHQCISLAKTLRQQTADAFSSSLTRNP